MTSPPPTAKPSRNDRYSRPLLDEYVRLLVVPIVIRHSCCSSVIAFWLCSSPARSCARTCCGRRRLRARGFHLSPHGARRWCGSATRFPSVRPPAKCQQSSPYDHVAARRWRMFAARAVSSCRQVKRLRAPSGRRPFRCEAKMPRHDVSPLRSFRTESLGQRARQRSSVANVARQLCERIHCTRLRRSR